MSDNQTAIEFSDVSFTLPDGKTLLSNLNLSVDAGRNVGAPRAQRLRQNDDDEADQPAHRSDRGTVQVEGKRTVDWDPIRLRRRIGYVIQEIGLFPHLTVEENIGVVPRLENWPAERIRERARALLTLVGLDADRFAARFPRELSGGQRQRIGVARALAADPPVILLDEPFGALDPITRREIQREFKTLQQELKKTMIFVTHDIAEAFVLGTRIALLKDGQLILLDEPQALLRSQHPEARAFAECFNDAQSSREPRVTLIEFFSHNARELLATDF